MKNLKPSILPVALLSLALAMAGTLAPGPAGPSPATSSFIVQSIDAATAAAAVLAAGGGVERELGIINAVEARLTASQRRQLDRQVATARVWADREVAVSGKGGGKMAGGGKDPFGVPAASFPILVGADRLQAEGITGHGVTVAVLDTGLWRHNTLKFDSTDRKRILAAYDAVAGRITSEKKSDDASGHGTHVMSIALGSDRDDNGNFVSIAPDADLVSVRAFGEDGNGTYADVIYGLQWLLRHQNAYGIDVVNLSFSAEPRSHYWDDPINQAVMRLWQSGMVVVASAGNRGPDAMTIGVPGNVPYVITVGAMGDSTLPITATEEHVAVFSSAGPTVEGFVKPEIIAPGGKLSGVMSFGGHRIALDHPEFAFSKRFFHMSGTSQSAAVVTGIVALMLQRSPQLTPDEVKLRLIDSARPAVYKSGKGSLAYSVFQQGAGLVDAYRAAHATATGSANHGLDIAADLAGSHHFRGPANAFKKGDRYVYYVADEQGNLLGDGFLWSDKYSAAQGFVWSEAFLWSDALIWSEAFLWNEAFLWSDAFLWSEAFLWSDTLAEPMSINHWVPQE